jgi:hypothetical protein
MCVRINLAALLIAGLVVAGCTAPKVTTQSLLVEMVNLAALAEYPDPPFTCKQFSSYDRRSKTPEDREGWFANGDCGQYLRVEERDGRKEYVMMDADGPGAIVRIWSANPKGTLRIYLDHSETPVIEAPMADVLGGTFAGIPKPIACERSRGWNSYFPIPYAEHCKVTSDEGGFYYHVNYRTYPEGTDVVSFKPGDLEQFKPDIEPVAEALAAPQNCGLAPAFFLAQHSTDKGVLLQRNEVLAWKTPETGSGAIVGIQVRVDAKDINSALRQLLLTMAFDGEQTVACPVGDFFGAAPGVNPYTSLPLGVSEEGEMWSHWVMPFRKSASMELRSTGDQPIRVWHRVAGSEYRWTGRSMHFHAKWRGELDVPTRPMQDWNYMTATGKGVFVGAAFNIANPVKHWWGEGDEKIYVDGETFPSHFGTGTEDYYGYAWCCNIPFTHAYHNQPRCDGPDNYGYTAVNRWHILDKIPFEKDFRFDMELWHWHPETKVAMSVVTYWYARPGSTDGFPPINPADLRVVEIPPYVTPRVEGALEGEEMAVLEVTGGTHEVQPWDGLSNEKHRWWRHGNVGDKFVLGFEVPQAGRYRVIARFLTAPDYGIHQLYINGEKAGEPIDLYSPDIKPSEERELGTFDLQQGQNTLTAEVVGANDQAVKSHMFGLDYLRLESTE